MTISTSAASDAEAYALLEAFGMPFSREGNPFVGPPDEARESQTAGPDAPRSTSHEEQSQNGESA